MLVRDKVNEEEDLCYVTYWMAGIGFLILLPIVVIISWYFKGLPTAIVIFVIGFFILGIFGNISRVIEPIINELIEKYGSPERKRRRKLRLKELEKKKRIEEREQERERKKTELRWEAEQILRKNAGSEKEFHKMLFGEENGKEYEFYKCLEKGFYMVENWQVPEERIVNALIKNNLDLKKAKKFLLKEIEKVERENAIELKMEEMKEREEKMKIREEAEKRLYGKVKTKQNREALSDKDKDIILEKFGNKCAICSAEEGLHIHHKDKDSSNNRMDNLIVLCGVCHKKVHMKVR